MTNYTTFKYHAETMKELGYTLEVIHEDSWSFYTVEYKEYSFGFGTPVFYRWWKNDGRKVKNQRRFRTVKQSSKGTYVTLDGVRVYFEMKSQEVQEVACMMCGNTNQDEVGIIELFSNEEGEDTVELQHICSEDMGCNANTLREEGNKMLKRLSSEDVKSITGNWEGLTLKQLEKMEVDFYHIIDNNQGNTLMCEVIQDQLILLHEVITKRGDQQ